MPIGPKIRTEIDARLNAIETVEDVRILLAVESGSRAWGFPSPDSDYDVRFIYARRRDDYLTLFERRDVIEQPIIDDIDLNGWDVRKALQLTLKSNAVISEWVQSPIVYRADAATVAALRALADKAMSPISLTYHYLRLAERHFDRLIDGKEQVSLKHYFYVLRPALALRCLRLHPGARVPMNLSELMERTGLAASLVAEVEALVAQKAVTRELGDGPRSPAIDPLIASEIAEAKAIAPALPRQPKHLLSEAEALFRSLIGGARGSD